MNSSLYTARVMHNRLAPKQHRFWYKVYLFYLDLDEIESLCNKFRWLSYNHFNLFSFRTKDHLQIKKTTGQNYKLQREITVKEQITTYLLSMGVSIGSGKIMLLTNLSVLGYNFNPVSFYFCFNEEGVPLCAVAEISNTFREMKLFFIGKENMVKGRFRQRVKKYFYVSPFIDLDASFDFNIMPPGDQLDIRIDDYNGQGDRFFISTLTGKRKPLTQMAMLHYFFSIPLIPLRIMWLIHWQAFMLWRKKIAFHRKGANQELQKNVYNDYKNNYK
ncbi:DUF1365 domain-containing protein [Pedobacter sp. HMWF019]|uniref:DUF1365 domain-containing protein n=1 Tax=Pedobacter sp. HMWF019 TaxID=2056856 RepID=UPI000D333A3B|nr:DUF1365 domain-containing protein [Pedobacter sp. HMWF019]PTT04171.1 DUF1365 domain-containing protein [Pedobacter sp. HMWF019]